MSNKVKFVEIVTSKNMLFALDGEGQIWEASINALGATDPLRKIRSPLVEGSKSLEDSAMLDMQDLVGKKL